MSWRDQLSPEARAILESSSTDEPSPARLDKIGTAVAAVAVGAVAAGVATTGGAGAAGAAGSSTAGATTAATSGAVTGAAAAGSTTGAAAGAGAAASTGTLLALGTPAKLLLAILTVAGAATAYQVVSESGEPSGSTTDNAAATDMTSQTSTPTSVPSTPSPTTREIPTAAPELPELPAPAEPPAVVTDRIRRPRADEATQEAPSAVDSPSEELRAMQQIQRLVDADPQQALRLIEVARDQVTPHFAPERELYWIEALVRLERHTEAQRAALLYEQNFPRSPYRERVRALLRTSDNVD